MQIEIAEPGRMTQTGSSLIRLIQNNNMPVLDLLVRESIQNSLDAKKSNSKYVEVDYLTGRFDSKKLAGELDCIQKSLVKRFEEDSYEYLAIRDLNTVGLTGVMDYKKVKDNAYGNLLKLVYEICKPQEAEGAGGSWGIGKTVYFRIGIGLVIYYSRVKLEDGTYQSRLAASLVENETSKDAMIPNYKEYSRRGIAWWGKEVEENVTQPITDEQYIRDFLEIFRIAEYGDEETGTTIIIPYIDREELLSNNRVEYLNEQEQEIIPFWCYSIEDYLSIAANVHYQQGAYLRMRINGKGISLDNMEPIFKVVQALYNRAGYVNDKDILSKVEEISIKPINVRKYLEDSTIGVLAFAKVNRELLKMNAPYNKPEPFMYFNNEIRDTEVNKPTVCFTRKPAMIVSYENVGAWVSNISPSAKDEYIIGLFVLNSYNRLRDNISVSNIEEYVRKSEMADHTSWSDWSEGQYNPRFVSKIQSNVNKTISREFVSTKEEAHPKVNSGLGKMFGDMLLPPEGFGKGASGNGREKAKSDTLKKTRSRFKFLVDAPSIRYRRNQMIIPMVLESSTKRKVSRTGVDILIDSESKKIDINEWTEKMGLDSPFAIKEFRLCIDMLDGFRIDRTEILSSEEKIEIEGLVFTKKVSREGTCHGLTITSEKPRIIKMRIDAVVELYRRDVKPSFSFEKEV